MNKILGFLVAVLLVSGAQAQSKPPTAQDIIAGVDSPTSGECHVQGVDVARLNESQLADWRNQNIGFIFQTFNLIPVLTAAENVELPMLGVVAGETERRQRAGMLLECVGLGNRAKHRIADLSGGEAQRVAIARALANSPSVILADEPTGNLDSQTASQILRLLEEVREHERAALVMVTHDALIAERATRVINLLDGQIVGEERRRQPA